jgi:hypothetical protein
MSAMAVSNSAAASSAAGLPPPPLPRVPGPAGLLILRGKNDVWKVECSRKADAPRHAQRVGDLLRDNALLCRHLSASPNSPSPQLGQLVDRVMEYQLRDLHTLLALHDWLQQPANAARELQVSFLSEAALYSWFQGNDRVRVNMLQKPQEAPVWTALRVRASAGAAAASAAADSGESARLSVRFCTSLGEALAGHALRVVFLPNLMWFSEFAPQDELHEQIGELLQTIQAVQNSTRTPQLYPPPSWDVLLEQKQRVYERFAPHMLPTRWTPLMRDIHTTAGRLAANLRAGKYVLKGSWSDGKQAVRTVVLDEPSTPSLQLIAALHEMCDGKKQTHFGLQPYVEGFFRNEFRTWCIALPDEPAHFRQVTTLRTGFAGADAPNRTAMHAVISAPLCADAAACYDLVQLLLTAEAYKDFWQQVADAGCRALRIDCGYDSAADPPRAFLNELTAPADAAIFTHAHETELVWALGQMFAEGIARLL